jgi:hypothetical protein
LNIDAFHTSKFSRTAAPDVSILLAILDQKGSSRSSKVYLLPPTEAPQGLLGPMLTVNKTSGQIAMIKRLDNSRKILNFVTALHNNYLAPILTPSVFKMWSRAYFP